jgi:Ni/Fe-hydrogenase subunit HybB-like protein
LYFARRYTVNLSVTSQKGWLMPKALCLIGLVIASLVFLIFLLDLVLGLSGLTNMAPFSFVSITMDLIFMVSSGGLAFMAWVTFREQK